MDGKWEKKIPFFYGWVIFTITFLIYTFMYGLRYSIGIFFTPIQQELGLTTAQTASGVTIFFWIYAFSAPFVGRIAEKIGVRKSVLIGGFLLGGGGAMVSFINKLWQFYLFWGVVAAAGSSALYVVPTMVLSKFFHKKRGLTVGWSSVGVSVGQAILIPIIASFIPVWGWRASIRVLALTVLLVTSIIGYLFIRENPESIGLAPDGGDMVNELQDEFEYKFDWSPREAIKTRDFKLIALSYFFAVGGIISILTFVVPHMIHIGIPPFQASIAFGIIGVMSAIGSFIFGLISDRYGRKLTILITTCGISAAFFIATLIPANLTLLFGWAILYGISYGGAPEQYAAIITDYFGRKYNTTLFGILTLAGGIGGGLFPLIGGYLVDQTGSYMVTLTFLSISMVLAAIFISKIKPLKN
jgi:MFS family permease